MITDKIFFPCITLAFAIAYRLQVSDLSSKALLFAKPLIYICSVLGIYVTIKDGVKVRKIRHSDKEESRSMERILKGVVSQKKTVMLMIMVLTYLLLLEYIGFIVTSLAFLSITMILLGVRRILLLTAVPLSVVAFVYFLFSRWLLVPLPKGILKFIL
jgi:hypothetical protein